MYTQCPHCKVAFQITAEQLKTADGDVRCGQCLSIFSALGHLSEDIPEQASTTAHHDTSNYSDWADEALNASLDTPTTEESPETATEAFHAADIDSSSFETVETTSNTDASGEFNSEANEPQTQPIANIPETDVPEIDIPEIDESEIDALETDASEIDVPEIDAPKFDESEIKHPENDISSIDSILETEAPLGNMEAATADLDAHIFTDTVPPDPMPEDETDTEFAEFFGDSLPESNASSEPGDAIIIEEKDLAPMASPDYADSPKEVLAALRKQENPAAVKDLTTETGPATIQQNPDETTHIPASILEDLHRDKAEQLRPSSTPWAIGSVLLMLAIVSQVTYFTRDELAKDPTLRPWLAQMCEFTGCTLAQLFDIRQIEIIGRDVRTHPTANKALIASTTIINNAKFVQPYPLLTLVFSDMNGTLLAQRRFMPQEYLPRGIDISTGMTPDLPVQIELELIDPGKAAVNYEFHAEADSRPTQSVF